MTTDLSDIHTLQAKLAKLDAASTINTWNPSAQQKKLSVSGRKTSVPQFARELIRGDARKVFSNGQFEEQGEPKNKTKNKT